MSTETLTSPVSANDVNSTPVEHRVGKLSQFMDPRAVATFDAHRQGPAWAVQSPVAVPGLEHAVLALMVKDEEEIISQNLQHHYQLGFRRFFILDNASTDRTALLIQKFRQQHPDAGVFYVYDYVVGHYQAAKMKALTTFIRSYLDYEDTLPSWIFFVDADEFITCAAADESEARRKFADLLANSEIKMLFLHWAQCASQEIITELPAEYNVFETFSSVWSRMTVPVSKIAFRLDSGLRTIQGNHQVEEYPFRAENSAALAEIGYYLFHFPNRTISQLRRKLVNGAKALSATKDRDGLENTAGHWREYYKWYQQHGDAALEAILRDAIKGSQ